MPQPPRSTLLRSLLASTVRGWRGTQVLERARTPKQLLVVFDRENDPDCRLLRELLTELQLDALIQPCPVGGRRYARQRPRGAQLPYLVDHDLDVQADGLHACVAHVLQAYSKARGSRGSVDGLAARATSRIASALRGDAGLQAKPSRLPRLPLELYSFESSPYSRLVRERLCELQLPWILRSFGKEQRADWGPPNLRFTLATWQPKPGGRRAQMQAATGKAQVPYLIDPNTQVELFESAAILDYLDRRYLR
jgi:hypothetical protein